jgi:DNA repair exonuclease SbcCD ATPase subunit
MNKSMVCFVLAAFASTSSASAVAEGSPVSKVFQMLSDLQAKIIKEGEAAQKTYDEFTEWCEDRSKNIGFEIKTGKSEVEDLTATIEKETSIASSLTTKIEELSDSIAKDEDDLKAATGIREEEAADFAAEAKESREVISTLERAIAVLSREMAKSGAAMVQLNNADSMTKALSAMVQASMLSSSDEARLTALVQSKQESDEDALGAPDPAVYKSKSDGIIGTLEDLLEKAQSQLDKATKTETANKHNYEMLKQSLEDEIEFAEKDLADAKKAIAASGEAKAAAEGDLSVTAADLNEDVETLKTLHQDCMKGAADFQS